MTRALVTDQSNSANDPPWECQVIDGQNRISNKLLSDSSGTEQDLSTQTNPSTFTWQTIDANSMISTDNVSGEQLSITDIQFTDQNTFSMVVNQSIALNCARLAAPPENSEPTTGAEQSMSYNGVIYPLTHGLEDIISFRTDLGHTHSRTEVSVADGVFWPFSVYQENLEFTISSPRDANVWLSARLYTPGQTRVLSNEYTFVPDSIEGNDPSLANQFFFQQGEIGLDSNLYGNISSSDNEFSDITAGTIIMNETDEGLRIEFDVTLANGARVTGSYEGTFPLI